MYRYGLGALRAIWWGTLAGGGPFLLLTVPIAIFGLSQQGLTGLKDAGLTLLIAAYPLLVAGAIVAPAFVAVGLPLTWLLHRMRIAPDRRYGLIGAATGALLPLAYGLLIDRGLLSVGFIIIPLGGLSGGASGLIWARELVQAAALAGDLRHKEQRDPGSSPG